MKPSHHLSQTRCAGITGDRLAGGGSLHQQILALRLQPRLVRKHRELNWPTVCGAVCPLTVICTWPDAFTVTPVALLGIRCQAARCSRRR